MFLEENSLSLRINHSDFSYSFLIALTHCLDETKSKIKIVLLNLSTIVNIMQKVNKQKRIDKQSIRERIFV